MMFPPTGLPRAILSDMDGVLLDTETLSKITFYALMESRGFDQSDVIFPQLVGRNKAAHYEIFRCDLPQGLDVMDFADEWMARYLAMLVENVPVKDGAMALLKRMKAHDIPVLVVTSSATDKAEMLLQRAGLRPFIEQVIGGDQVDSGKPAPDIYLKAAATLPHPIDQMLAIEDSNYGVMAAHRAGAVTVQIPDLTPPSDEVKALNPIILNHLDDLADHFNWPTIPLS
jgi:HAD superfamily hydrolase (TIGR01509 family)